uniref:Uncharacterized protein n=1 Tax=Physcomitrium patens TaxID=3218 RepID=A0A2K1JQ88_PHYPA|nr:hypothetical protein PHYPA_016084 [Physcomitrium patens]
MCRYRFAVRVKLQGGLLCQVVEQQQLE